MPERHMLNVLGEAQARGGKFASMGRERGFQIVYDPSDAERTMLFECYERGRTYWIELPAALRSDGHGSAPSQKLPLLVVRQDGAARVYDIGLNNGHAEGRVFDVSKGVRKEGKLTREALASCREDISCVLRNAGEIVDAYRGVLSERDFDEMKDLIASASAMVPRLDKLLREDVRAVESAADC